MKISKINLLELLIKEQFNSIIAFISSLIMTLVFNKIEYKIIPLIVLFFTICSTMKIIFDIIFNDYSIIEGQCIDIKKNLGRLEQYKYDINIVDKNDKKIMFQTNRKLKILQFDYVKIYYTKYSKVIVNYEIIKSSMKKKR